MDYLLHSVVRESGPKDTNGGLPHRVGVKLDYIASSFSLAQACLVGLRREFKRRNLFQGNIIEKVDELTSDLPFLRGYQTG